MYVNVNSEICDYKENIFYGLNLSQVIIGTSAVVTELAVYFVCEKWLNLSDFIVTFLFVICAVPFGAAFIVNYNNMHLGKLCKVLFKYYFVQDKRLKFHNTNKWYYAIKNKEKENV